MLRSPTKAKIDRLWWIKFSGKNVSNNSCSWHSNVLTDTVQLLCNNPPVHFLIFTAFDETVLYESTACATSIAFLVSRLVNELGRLFMLHSCSCWSRKRVWERNTRKLVSLDKFTAYVIF